MKKLIPADTVDAKGNAWETVGENIRRGEKDFSENYVKAIVDSMFPVGSIYCGENSYILSVGKWETIVGNGRPLVISGSTSSASLVSVHEFVTNPETNLNYYTVRLHKRIQ